MKRYRSWIFKTLSSWVQEGVSDARLFSEPSLGGKAGATCAHPGACCSLLPPTPTSLLLSCSHLVMTLGSPGSFRITISHLYIVAHFSYWDAGAVGRPTADRVS